MVKNMEKRDMARITRRSFTTYGVSGAIGMPLMANFTPAAPATINPAFKLGLVTYNLGAKFDVPTLIRVCKATGIGPVELRTTHNHGVEPSLTKDQRKEVRKKFQDAGVEIWGCGSVCEFHAAEQAKVQENIETCKKFVELVQDIGGKGVKVRPNGFPKGVSEEKTLEQIGKALVECGKAASNAGVEIWVEVHGSGTAKPKNMHTIMKHCNHPSVGVTWNSNADDVQNGSVKESFELLKPWIKSCHINDLFKDQSGQYPYRELFGLFAKTGYNRTTLIEVGRTFPDEASTIEFLKYYKALWLELCKG